MKTAGEQSGEVGIMPVPLKTARIALIGLDESECRLLAECFQQFGIRSAAFACDQAERLQTEKFDACVLRLEGTAERVLGIARSSPINFRIVVYGVAATMAQAVRYSRFTINAILDDPLDRRTALRAVRATHLLVLHEFRRYVRIPVVTAVSMTVEGRRLAGQCHEISGGGMSVRFPTRLPPGLPVELEFALPNLPALRINATTRWSKDDVLGLRFVETDPARQRIRDWIDNFLDIS